jgi:hypothetical protein
MRFGNVYTEDMKHALTSVVKTLALLALLVPLSACAVPVGESSTVMSDFSYTPDKVSFSADNYTIADF